MTSNTWDRESEDLESFSKLEVDNSNYVDPGIGVTAKKLYEGEKDDDGYKTWLDEPPKEVAEVAHRKAQRGAHPILLRYVKSVDDSGDKVYVLGTLVVQSAILKTALRTVLSKYPSAGIHSKEPKFKPPFQPFYHRWTDFEKYLAGCSNDQTQLQHVQLLHSILDAELKPIRNEVKSLTKHGVITFNVLWALYPPGTTVFGQMNDKDHAFVVKRTVTSSRGQDHRKFLDIVCECIDWDGYDFGYTEETFNIREFPGEKRIAELEVVPKDFHQDGEGLVKRLAERGEKWSSLVQGGHKGYSGKLYTTSIFEAPQYIEGRILIDGQAYGSHNFGFKLPLRPINSQDEGPRVRDKYSSDEEDNRKSTKKSKNKTRRRRNSDDSEDYDRFDNSFCRNPTPPPPPPPGAFDLFPPPAPVFPAPLPLGFGPPPAPVLDVTELTTEQKVFCKSTLPGFCLTTKRWAEFDVEGIKDCTFNDDAFGMLVMNPARKSLIRALVQEQGVKETHFDDIIQGKGLGLIMLLSGPPGTGKTLTAESIADALRLPLYTLSAMELGDEPTQIERSLRDVFQLAANWNAVLLLDEADAFLEKRINNVTSEAERDRNKRVATFLRLLEYYRGTLIMTTNRPITFDEAFYSRIHITLRFESLDAEARKAVWTNFLAPANAVPNVADLNMLARIDINGREIKNVVKMASLLAKSKDEALKVKHIMDVVKVVETPGVAKM